MHIQWFATHRLHDAPDPIDVAAILPALAGIEHQRRVRELASIGSRQLIDGLIVFQSFAVPQPVDESGRVGEEVMQRNRSLGWT